MSDTQSKNLLIVDDNVPLAENLQEILEDEGFAVTLAHSGADAQRELRKKHFDLVLTDMRMPGLSGLDVLEAARREFPGVPVAIMTAYSDAAILSEARTHGALTILIKPVSFERLIELVHLAVRPERRVLLIEDEAALRVDLAEILAGDRALTFACGSITEGQRCLGAVTPDVAVIDRRLPEGDALPWARALAGNGPSPLPVLMISGGLREAAELYPSPGEGTVEWLEKPFSPQDLLDRLRKLSCPKA